MESQGAVVTTWAHCGLHQGYCQVTQDWESKSRMRRSGGDHQGRIRESTDMAGIITVDTSAVQCYRDQIRGYITFTVTHKNTQIYVKS